jgi:hypothetical protein
MLLRKSRATGIYAMNVTHMRTARAVPVESDTSVRKIARPQLPTEELMMNILILQQPASAASLPQEVPARLLMAVAIVISFLVPPVPAFAQHAAHEAPAAVTVAEIAAAQRDLWVGHIFWVRNVAIDTFAGSEKAAAVAEQEVVANARAIAASIEPFYGNAASKQLFDLLAGHYGAIKEYLGATAAGSRAGQDAAVRSLTGNATEIARFLSGANPNLPFDTLNGLLLAHGGHHVQQARQLKGNEYAQEAQTWAAMKQHMHVIADALAGALAKQFPAKFAG